LSAMQAASLEILEKAQVPAQQARAILQAIELELVAQHEVLATKHDIGLIRHSLDASRHDLELKIERLRSELVRWVFSCMLGQTAILLGAGYFFLEHFRK